jgi:hypothetical protein
MDAANVRRRTSGDALHGSVATTSATGLSSRTGTGLQCRVGGLKANCAYYLRVAAENDEGIGYYREFIEPVRPTKPKSEHSVTIFTRVTLQLVSFILQV